MSLIINLNSLQYIYDFKSMGVYDFVIGTPYFSCRDAIKLDYCDILHLKQEHPDIHLYVLVNALIEQSRLEGLKEHLQRLNDLQITGILFQDFGVLDICREMNYKIKKIYAPDTLNTNHMTLSFLKKQGVDGAFLAREISLEEKQHIAHSVNNLMTIVQIHGVEYMAYSKRKLLSHYKDKTGLDFSVHKDENVLIQANQVDQKCHIYEDQFGCHILSENQICALDVLNHFDCFDYLYIDGQFIDTYHLLEIVHLYIQAQEAIAHHTFAKESQELMRLLYQLTPGTHYYHSFLFDSTVYKISDVRKREENERSQSNH